MESVQTASASATDTACQVFFVSLRLRDEVHAQALGFTRLIFEFVWATDAAHAERIAREYIAGFGNEVRRLAGAPSLGGQQDPARYTFPEQILGLPMNVLEDIVGLNDPKAIETLRRRNGLIAKGRKLLEEAARGQPAVPAHSA